MRKLFILITLGFLVMFTTGCKQPEFTGQSNKENRCLNIVKESYAALMVAKQSPSAKRNELEKMAFKHLKIGATLRCTSTYAFLALHYKYGIGTKRNMQESLYYKKLAEHYMNTDTETRLQYQGTLPTN